MNYYKLSFDYINARYIKGEIILKEYNFKKIKDKGLVMNVILVISTFIIAQVSGIIMAYKFFSNNLVMSIICIVSMNIIGYKIALK